MSNQAHLTSTIDLILMEVRELRKEVNEFRSEMQQRVTTLETQMHPLIDNGQPGRMTKVEGRVTKLEHWRVYVLGAAGAVAAIIEYAVNLFSRP